MRKSILWLIVAWLIGARVAYAGYDYRASELREVLKKKQLTDDKERDVLTKALDEYIKHRQECLEALVRIIEEANADSKQEQAWVYRLDGCKEDAARLADAIKSISGTPSIDAFNFVAVTQVEEVNFFTKLGQTKVGEQRDKITANGKNVADMTQKLDEKWRYLLDQDQSLDEQEKKIVEQISSIVDKSFDESDKERRTIREKLTANVQVVAEYAKNFGKPVKELLSSLPSEKAKALAAAIDGINKLADPIIAYAKIYLKTNQDYIARSSEYTALLQSERGGIYVLFNGFFQDTETFLRTNGFDIAKAEGESLARALAAIDAQVALPMAAE